MEVSDKYIIVSVICKTYNHVNYIQQTLDSILSQKADFYFEILVHDDASTDGTVEVIKEYQEKYPLIIKPIFEVKNQYSKSINSHFKNSIPRAKGKFIALCDGDDYWIDTAKLQMQVDFLETHLKCGYVYTKNLVLCKGAISQSRSLYTDDIPNIFDFNYFMQYKLKMPGALSIMFKRDVFTDSIPDFLLECIRGDWAIFILSCAKYKIGFINKYTCVYRQGIGITSTGNLERLHKNSLKINRQLNKATDYKFTYWFDGYLFSYKNLTYLYLEKGKLFKGIKTFLKTLFIYFFRSKSKVSILNLTLFIKHCIKLALTDLKKTG